jgi:hypothetical protein
MGGRFAERSRCGFDVCGTIFDFYAMILVLGGGFLLGKVEMVGLFVRIIDIDMLVFTCL